MFSLAILCLRQKKCAFVALNASGVSPLPGFCAGCEYVNNFSKKCLPAAGNRDKTAASTSGFFARCCRKDGLVIKRGTVAGGGTSQEAANGKPGVAVNGNSSFTLSPPDSTTAETHKTKL
jgi:hypothetical protein